MSRSIALSWLMSDDGNSPILFFTVQYSVRKVEWDSETSAINSSRVSISIHNLQPDTLYKFRVSAANSVGISDWSKEVSARTAEECPGGPPRRIQWSTLSATSMKVNWLAPEKSLQYGRLLGYRLVLKFAAPPGENLLDIPDSHILSYTLVNLEPDTNYTITVAAYNSQGLGPYSEPIGGYTFENVPSYAPVNVTAIADVGSITVHWEKPILLNLHGQLSGYRVIIHSINKRQDERDHQVFTTTETSLALKTLRAYTNYSIEVCGYTSYGDGLRSSPVYVKTPPTAARTPCQVKAAAINSTAVFVSWLPPCESTGLVIEYELITFRGEKPMRRMSIGFPNLKTHAMVTNLTQGQVYGFTVKARHNQTDFGEESPEVTASPTTPAPPTVALAESTADISFHSSLMLPCLAAGDPQPYVSWAKLSKNILPSHLTAFPNGTLYTDHVVNEDAGYYTCTASNGHGQAQHSVQVNIQDLPSPPVIEVRKTLSSIVQINWHGTDNGGSSYKDWLLQWRNSSKWNSVDIPGSKRSFWLRNLSCGQMYDIRMKAINEERGGSFSNITTIQTRGGKPKPPSDDLHVTDTDNTSLTLNLSAWDSNGCRISHFSVSYRVLDKGARKPVPFVSSAQQLFSLENLESGTWYDLEVTAFSTAGATTVSFHVSTLTIQGSTIQPRQQVKQTASSNVALYVSLGVFALFVTLIVGGIIYYWKYKRQHLNYGKGNKSRHSVVSDSSDLDNEPPHRSRFTMPRENMSTDSHIWLLRNQSTSGNCEPAQAVADKADSDYETCTPTLTYAKAKQYKKNAKCVENTRAESGYHSGGTTKQNQLLHVEGLNSLSNEFNKFQLKQHEVAVEEPEEEFPPPPPEVLHEYHGEPIGYRCVSHEFMAHNELDALQRPNTTSFKQLRTSTPRKMSQYPSALSSMVTVSSNNEELLMAYHNSKINPLKPALCESPQRLSTSTSAQSSIATEPGIRMFTQSPPHPEESRQAVCEVPIYPPTLRSNYASDHSSDTNTTADQEAHTKYSFLHSPHPHMNKRKNKLSKHRLKSRDLSDEMSTNSDDNITYGIPNKRTMVSSASDKGYGTKTKDTVDSHKSLKARECGDLYEEEEKLLLVQAAAGAGETTPPSSVRNLSAHADDIGMEDTKLIDRHYRTVSAECSDSIPVEPYTDDYTIV
ncbi:cell adhesion molecule DSCAM-like [Watersipora subatra]|uniref:cell adhesion molecule DSCAM-like n=1 Tax=Watersipora subatra TaxID=2589382 RepID=UPI00355B6236